ncbi:hypothetical protein CFP56_042768, partial [Quercus suber]
GYLDPEYFLTRKLTNKSDFKLMLTIECKSGMIFFGSLMGEWDFILLNHMMLDSNIRLVGPMVTNVEKVMTPSLSSSMVKDPYVSSKISGIELVSGVIPSITPRYKTFIR